jgi:ATP-dependent Clp protease ATP-binding subunit ClpA
MFARFTDEARQAMVLAQEQAARLHYPWLGTEHLLLGILQQRDTPATAALRRLGVSTASVEDVLVAELGPPSPDRPLGDRDEDALRTVGIDLREVRRRVESVFGPGALDRARPGYCGLPVMPRLKLSLERASRIAQGRSVDTDDLLLGLTEVRDALAMLLLERLGVTADAIRAAVEAQR